jgi:phosphoserine phosphatase
MRLALTLVSTHPAAAEEAGRRAAETLLAAEADAVTATALSACAVDHVFENDEPLRVRQLVEAALADLPVDLSLQRAEGRRKGLLLSDMDSTLITTECLDELADYVGLKAEVAAVTRQAMNGEIDFEAALRSRVALLKGLPLAAVQACLRDRVRLSPGAEVLAATMTKAGARLVVVSGGFTVFTGPVAALAGFQDHRANRLLDDGERLVGAVADPVLGAEAKKTALMQEAAAEGLALNETLAVGDGANDLAMIAAAGLGVAYRAKPSVRAAADARIDHTDLTTLLYFQGFHEREFIRPS